MTQLRLRGKLVDTVTRTSKRRTRSYSIGLRAHFAFYLIAYYAITYNNKYKLIQSRGYGMSSKIDVLRWAIKWQCITVNCWRSRICVASPRVTHKLITCCVSHHQFTSICRIITFILVVLRYFKFSVISLISFSVAMNCISKLWHHLFVWFSARTASRCRMAYILPLCVILYLSFFIFSMPNL